jgi:DNA polymerase IV
VLNVLYVDMNSYFASVEQQLRPELRGRPVAVVPVEADTTSCIAASYEAKAFGVRTGTRVGDAKAMCPGLVLVMARTDEYIKMHHAMQTAIDSVLPVAMVHSIDEVSCRLLGTQRQPDVALRLAQAVKQATARRCGARSVSREIGCSRRSRPTCGSPMGSRCFRMKN